MGEWGNRDHLYYHKIYDNQKLADYVKWFILLSKYISNENDGLG